MTVRIDQARPEDAPDLTECILAAYAGYRAQGIDLPPVSEGVAEDIATDHVWIAWKGSAIAGGLILSIDPPVAYLKNVAVHPGYAGQGIARQLLERANFAAQQAGCKLMQLTTHANIPSNIALYQHLGWRITATEGVKVAMERDLNA